MKKTGLAAFQGRVCKLCRFLLVILFPWLYPAAGHGQGIFQQPNYWCDMRNQRTGSGDYRHPIQMLYNDNGQPLTWRPMSEDINAQPNPPTPTPADVISNDGGIGQVPGLSGIPNASLSTQAAVVNQNQTSNQVSGQVLNAGGGAATPQASSPLSQFVLPEPTQDFSSLINNQ